MDTVPRHREESHRPCWLMLVQVLGVDLMIHVMQEHGKEDWWTSNDTFMNFNFPFIFSDNRDVGEDPFAIQLLHMLRQAWQLFLDVCRVITNDDLKWNLLQDGQVF